ncbi:MAG: ATP-binding cassette domain-containing protein, partial [Chitinispirillaceae bacterium]|nr:ATP-binding cassette domain-containing protein [Chitinispirillaceae bacterium]
DERKMDCYRRETVGFVWQNSSRNLIPYLSARDNVLMPMTRRGRAGRGAWSDELLAMVGLSHRKNHKLMQLSGGEQQRVAIAIALANRPKILLADEPTGSVDSKTTEHILDIFRTFIKTLGVTIVIVTHDLTLSKKVDRIVAIRDGKVSSEFIRRSFYSAELARMKGGLADDEEDSHIEMVVLDKTGRLQLPGEYLDDLKNQGRDKFIVTREGGKIVLTAVKKD